MKNQAVFTTNKKLILHFDLHNVLTLPAQDKDLYVYDLCADWVWGKLEKNSKEEPEKVTGWKIAVNTLSVECPEPELVSYKTFLNEYLKPSEEEYQKLILNLSKGPASKAKSEIEKNIKNITLPKTLGEAIKESATPNDKLLTYYTRTGKYQILPSFFKLLMNLKKTKREFAIIVKAGLKDSHHEVITELNRFFGGEHPLFNGQNGTPAIKWDGSKGTHNFHVEESHQTVFYQIGDDIVATYGTLQLAEEKDPEMFKQKFKSLKHVKLCQGPEEIYSVGHTILSESAIVYEINPLRTLVIDPNDYLTHEIYFTNSENEAKVYSCLGQPIGDSRSFINKVSLFEYLKDVDYFIKVVEQMEGTRGAEINKIQKGEKEAQQNIEEQGKEDKLTNYEYLKKNLLPVLEGALKQVDLHRPEDPLAFIALYCLKNRQKLQ